MIKAIIFDCFGVLATDGWQPFKRKYFKDDQFDQATDLMKQNDAGFLPYNHFLEQIAKMANIQVSDVEGQIEGNKPDEELLVYIKEQLKPKYKIGMLSNAGDNWLKEIFKPEQVELFDSVNLSYQNGYVKPQHRAYEAAVTQLGVELSECVFIDDQPGYCQAAKDAGMGHVIIYKGFDQMKNELEPILTSS